MKESKPKVEVEGWEPGEVIITVNGKPVGSTITNEKEAERICRWLKTSIREIVSAIQSKDS